MKQQDLFKHLIKFNDMTVAHLANISKLSRPNIYAWLNEKPKIISQERETEMMRYLGLEDGKLSTKIVHKWNIDPSARLFKELLIHFYGNDILKKVIVNFVNTGSRLCNIVRIPFMNTNHLQQEVILLLMCKDPLSRGYPFDIKKLGFGISGDDRYIADWQWDKWWEDELCKPQTFNVEYGILTHHKNEANNSQDFVIGNTDEATNYVELKLSFKNQLIEKAADNAGLRALIRALLNEISQLNNKSKWLDKKNRDLIYDENYKSEFDKLSGKKDIV